MFCRTKRVAEDGWGSLSGGRVRNTFVLGADHGRIGPAVELTVQYLDDLGVARYLAWLNIISFRINIIS